MSFSSFSSCSQVEEIFLEMVAKEPLLRIAISRGLTLSLEGLDQGQQGEEGEERQGEREEERRGRENTEQADGSPAALGRGEGGRRREGGSERKPDAAAGKLPSGECKKLSCSCKFCN